MRKKLIWMAKDSVVLALGKRGVITKLEENTFEKPGGETVTWIYSIDVKLDGEKKSQNFHPNDVEEYSV